MRRILFAVVLCCVFAGPSMAAGLMKPKDAALPDLEIEEHQVRVTINNGFAVTEVEQLFRNPHDRDLEAVYTFPLPENAALSELGLWIDGEESIGEVVEKERAREIYREEKSSGRDSALAEQREYYAFDVHVSRVPALDTVRVRLLYLQAIEIDTGVGRYVYALEEGRIDEEAQAFWDRNERVSGRFTFEATLRSSYPVDDVRMTGFASDGRSVVTQDAPDTWHVWVDTDEGAATLDRDLVLYYRLAANQPARVDLLPYRSGEGPGTFMVVVTPGTDLQPTTGGVDWTFVLDVSGSMGHKIATAGNALSRTLEELRSRDRFRIITFADRARHSGWREATVENVEAARETIATLGVRGGTNMYAGIEAGLQGLDSDRPNAVILISDGGANVGPTRHGDFVKLLQGVDIRVFTFVMGQGANRPLMSRLADESDGFSMSVSNSDDLYGRIRQAQAKLGREALHGVRLRWSGGDVGALSPRRIPSAYHGQQIVAFGRYAKPGKVELTLEGRISGEEKSWKTAFLLPERDERFPEIERLWALASIEGMQREIDLGESESALREEIVAIGTQYSIVSDYTSMIVVREERFEELGLERRNRERVAEERSARNRRSQQAAPATRVDRQQPMFGGREAHDDMGGGAAGPAFLGLIAALYGARAWISRSRRRG